jgi:hypothetical protein
MTAAYPWSILPSSLQDDQLDLMTSRSSHTSCYLTRLARITARITPYPESRPVAGQTALSLTGSYSEAVACPGKRR